mgnify:CR=1 FL=1
MPLDPSSDQYPAGYEQRQADQDERLGSITIIQQI